MCFHAQQCIEKYLKAILTEHGVTFPKIHDLVKLGEMGLHITPELKSLEADLDLLTRYAIAFRYPGETATQEEAKATIKAMEKVRKLARDYLAKLAVNKTDEGV